MQGKGLFVAAYDTQAALRLFRIVNEDGTRELPRFGKLLRIRLRTATANERRRLVLEKDDKVVGLRRTRAFADGTHMLETIVLPATRFPDIKQRLGSERPALLYDFYEQAYGIRIVSVTSRIRAVAASAEDAGHVDVRQGAPLLEIERVAFELCSTPVELRTTLCDTFGGRHYLDADVS